MTSSAEDQMTTDYKFGLLRLAFSLLILLISLRAVAILRPKNLLQGGNCDSPKNKGVVVVALWMG